MAVLLVQKFGVCKRTRSSLAHTSFGLFGKVQHLQLFLYLFNSASTYQEILGTKNYKKWL